MTNHDAFGYYVDRYGLDYVGAIIPSFDSSSELSASAIDDLVTKIRATGVHGRVLRELAPAARPPRPSVRKPA